MIKLTSAADSRAHDAHEYKVCKYSFVRLARTHHTSRCKRPSTGQLTYTIPLNNIQRKNTIWYII